MTTSDLKADDMSYIYVMTKEKNEMNKNLGEQNDKTNISKIV